MIKTNNWARLNQRYFEIAIERIRARLDAFTGQTSDIDQLDTALKSVRGEMEVPSAFEQVCESFNLSEFESELLLLCAAMEVIPRFGDQCGVCQQDPLLNFPTFGLALAVLPHPSWAAITPVAGLRKLKLIEIEGGYSMVRNRVRISERVLHFMLGLDYVDVDLGFITRCEQTQSETSATALKVRDITFAMVGKRSNPVEIIGVDAEETYIQACNSMGLQPFKVNASDLPNKVEEFCCLWSRESLLMSGALLIVDADSNPTIVQELCLRASFPLYLGSLEPLQIDRSHVVHLEPPSVIEVQENWEKSLNGKFDVDDEQLLMIAETFRMSPQLIRTVVDSLGPNELSSEQLWEACRKNTRQKLNQLALRVESHMRWDDLVLSADQKDVLLEIVSHVRNRNKVYSSWGFGERNIRGLGISALFAGPSGTGKTLSAEVIAGELGLDLYVIDLSQLVSKYIGETEKNLRKIFSAAEESGGVLVFDEADAVFGQRSEVRDSHDRFANMGVSYLLQLTESYRGLVILTTNMRQALDQAFMRRLRFVVNFQYPEYDQRLQLWSRAFPERVPTSDLDYDWLAKINLTGGQIRSVAVNAAFRAASSRDQIGMQHIASAIQSEFVKMDRPMSEHEMGASWS